MSVATLKAKYFSSYYCRVNQTDYLLDRILLFKSPATEESCPIPLKIGFNFGSIIHQYQKKDIFLGEFNGPNHGKFGYYIPKDFYISVKEFVTDSNLPVLFKTTGCGQVDFCHLGPNCLYNPKANFYNCADFVIKPIAQQVSTDGLGITEPITHGSIYFDGTGAAENKLVVRMIPPSYKMNAKNEDFDPVLMNVLIPIQGNTLNIRTKIGHDLKYYLINLIDSNDISSHSLTN